MNKAIIMGRVTRDAQVRYTQGAEQMAIARFTIAVDRRTRSDQGQQADFISCVAFGRQGEFMEKYGIKGTKFAIEGRIQTGSYTNREGVKVYTTEIVTESIEFAESKATSEQNKSATAGQQSTPTAECDDDGFMNIPDGIEDELPFS